MWPGISHIINMMYYNVQTDALTPPWIRVSAVWSANACIPLNNTKYTHTTGYGVARFELCVFYALAVFVNVLGFSSSKAAEWADGRHKGSRCSRSTCYQVKKIWMRRWERSTTGGMRGIIHPLNRLETILMTTYHFLSSNVTYVLIRHICLL